MKLKFTKTPPSPGNDLFQQFQAAFGKITGLPLDMLSPGEFRIPDGAPDFCKIMGLTRQSCDACIETHGLLQASSSDRTQSHECFAGLTSSSVPVHVRGKVVAYLHTGHVFLGRNSKSGWEKLRKFLARQGLDAETCEQALVAAKATDPAHYRSALHLLEIFARQLSDSLPGIEAANSYPAVEKALRMVREDLEHDWTLSKAAAKAKMNPSYFSDTFRKSTGETFTACLARLRTERARRLLESTRLGISEAAFASGFRSISQFNRVFKKLTGISPGQFREARKSARPPLA
ncbi:MAG: helix-turn-helix domain-containing protein [Verrucomicrobiota bacterium]